MTREALQKSLLEEDANLKARFNLFNLYKDLDLVGAGHGRAWYTSKEINEETGPDKVSIQINRSCGCCPDAIVYASPYCTVEGINVYATPIKCTIGEGLTYGSGIDPYPSRFNKYKEYGYSEDIIERIEHYLTENPPVRYEDENEYGDEEESDE